MTEKITRPLAPTDLGLVADADLGGNGTDNAAAIQAAIDTGLPVVLPPGRYLVRSTLRLNPAVGLSLGGTYGGRLGPDSVAAGTWLCWGGPPGGTLLDLRGIKCRLHDLGLVCATNTSLDRCVDVESPDVYPNLSSQHVFENVSCYGLFGPVRCGWVVGEDQRGNNEFHWWRSCVTRQCAYAGVSVPNGTAQAKNLLFEDCTFAGSGRYQDYGVVFAQGSADFWRCNFNALGVAAAWFGSSYEPCNWVGCTGELNRRFLELGNVYQANLIGCRLNLGAALSPQPYYQEFIHGAQNLMIEGCVFEDLATQLGYIRPGNGGTLSVTNAQFSSPQPFSADDETTWRGSFRNVRCANNLLPEGGHYWNRNDGGVAFAGAGLILSSGHYPLRGNWQPAGAIYQPAPDEARLYFESGKLWLKVGGKPPVEVVTQ